jgi:uncharacterized protein with PQ loop repeat
MMANIKDSMLLIGIVLSSLFIVIWSYMAYIAITDGAPVIVYAVLPVLIAVGIGLLGSLILAFRKTPEWLRRFEHRFFDPY